MTDKQKEKFIAMREGGKKLGSILSELLAVADPGISLLDLESLAQKRIKEAGGLPSFSTVEDYKWATCLCVNDVIVHGIPTKYVLKDGDLLTIDIGMIYGGYHTDTAWTKVVRHETTGIPSEVSRFLDVGKNALADAIIEATPGNRIGHISQKIQSIVEPAGYGVVKTLVGHGVGKTLHESPQIPGVLLTKIEQTTKIVAGMSIAIEIIYAYGSPEIVYVNNDGWSIGSADRSLTAVFEQTILIGENGPEIATPNPEFLAK